jgi:hypothetical protein
MNKRFGTLTVAALLTASMSVGSHVRADDTKQTLVQKVIPDAIKQIGKEAGDVLGVFSGVIGAADTAKGLLQTFGILSKDPDMRQLLADLTTHLDQIAGALDWKIGATARDTRYAQATSAFYDLMDAMQAGPASSQILAEANTSSKDAIGAVEGPEQSAFMRVYSKEVTAGSLSDQGYASDWSDLVTVAPEVTNGEVYDWRLGIPEFLQYLAIRTQVMAVLDPNWKANGEFGPELQQHRDFLAAQLQKINDGIHCASSFGQSVSGQGCGLSGCDISIGPSYTICADVYTGIFVVQYGTFGSATADSADVLKQQVIDKTPIAELNDALSKLDDFAAAPQ